MRAQVDARMCNGSALCEQICPEVFEVQEGISMVKGSQVPSEAEQSCREAVDGCPTGAISIEE